MARELENLSMGGQANKVTDTDNTVSLSFNQIRRTEITKSFFSFSFRLP